MAAATHTDSKGLSVLREGADDAEFRSVAEGLLAGKGDCSLVGVAELRCTEIRALISNRDGDRRREGDRHYIVVDTDTPELPYHADVFNTFPRPKTDSKESNNKGIWRKERKAFFSLMSANVISKADFRRGLLADLP